MKATIGGTPGTNKIGEQSYPPASTGGHMRKLPGLLIALFLTAATAQAQSAASIDSTSAKSSSAVQPSAEEALDNLQKAAEDLSKAVDAAVVKVANSPELKTAALQIAAGAISLAQRSLADQLKMIEATLNAAARQIAAAQTANIPKVAPSTQAPSK